MTALRLVVGALALVTTLGSTAHADYSKAWAAAKENLPATTKGVLVGDVALGVKTATYATLLPMVLSEERDLQQGLALVKGACKIDAVSVVDGFVIAGDPEAEQGAVFIQLAGIDRPKLSTCIQNVLKVMGEAKATVTQDGQFTVIGNGRDAVYVAWVTADVIVIGIEPEKKAQLQAWIGHKGAFAHSPVQAQLAKVDVKAPGWGALALDKPFDDKDMPIRSARGTLSIANGVFIGELIGSFASPRDAKKTADEMTREMTREVGRKNTPPAAKKVISAFKIKQTGAHVTVKGKVSEKDLVAAISSIK
ncbi:MAG: hypothetical protein WKG01_33100 [Kofleriaceae bacterium]